MAYEKIDYQPQPEEKKKYWDIAVGFQVNNELFSENSLCFRNTLVRSNYADYKNGIVNTDKFLHLFFENLLYGGQNHLSLREEMFQEPEL